MAWEKISDVLKSGPGREVTVKGWVRTRRDSKAGGGMSFVAVHDGTSFQPIQAVCKADLANYESEVAHLNTGCSVEVTGELVESKGKGQSVEIQAAEVKVVGWVEDPDTYPVSQKRHTFEYLREVAHLRVRTNSLGAVARTRHALAAAVHRFFDEREFYYVHTPIVTASDAEGAGEMFRVSTLDMLNIPRTPEGEVDYSQDFFGRESNLTVSGQLNVETYCCALSRVYTFGPTFRAENSNTARHLAEFWMIEPEIAFADLSDNADLAEDMLKYVLKDVLERRADDMAFFDERIEKGIVERLGSIVDAEFKRITYTEAVEILEKSNEKFEYRPEWGVDLQTEHERYLTEKAFSQPVVVTDYPKSIKAFYMRANEPDAQGRETVAAMDVLVPGVGELVGGSQREERLDQLDARIGEMERDHGMDPKAYWWYRDLRRYGTVPHAGFGLGFDRLVQFCTGMANIRDVIPFPRAPKQAEF
ncbi:MAG: asparagine--tRNA ligase [Planctomycetota bacterium]